MTSCFYLWRHISMVPQMGQRVQNGHVTCIVGVSMEIAFWRHFSSLYLWRSGCAYPSDFEGKCMLDFDWKVFVRSGIRTHAHRSGLRPERSALDLSAILTHTTLSWAANEADGQRARVTTFCSCVRRTPVSHHRALCHRDGLNPSSLVTGIFLHEPSWVSLRCKEMIMLEISV